MLVESWNCNYKMWVLKKKCYWWEMVWLIRQWKIFRWRVKSKQLNQKLRRQKLMESLLGLNDHVLLLMKEIQALMKQRVLVMHENRQLRCISMRKLKFRDTSWQYPSHGFLLLFRLVIQLLFLKIFQCLTPYYLRTFIQFQYNPSHTHLIYIWYTSQYRNKSANTRIINYRLFKGKQIAP